MKGVSDEFGQAGPFGAVGHGSIRGASEEGLNVTSSSRSSLLMPVVNVMNSRSGSASGGGSGTRARS